MRKVVIKVGEVSVTIEGLELQRRHIKPLLMECAGIAAALAPEQPEASPIGFSAHIERLPDEIAEEPYYDDEDV